MTEKLKETISSIVANTTAYIGLSNSDLKALGEAAEIVLPRADVIIGAVVTSLLNDTAAKSVLEAAGVTPEKARALFKSWMVNLFKGSYDEKHALSLFRIGLAHMEGGVDERLIACSIGAFAREITRILVGKGRADLVEPTVKALFWNLAVMLSSYQYMASMFSKTVGVNPRVLRRITSINAKDVYSDVRERLKEIALEE